MDVIPEQNPSSPAGQIESVGDAADRLVRLHGWRREVARWGVIALLMLPLVVVVLAQLTKR